MNLTAINSALLGLQVIARVFNISQRIGASGKPESLSRHASSMTLRPIIAVDRELIYHENIRTLISTAINIYGSVYITAISADNEIEGISVKSIVGKYSPNREHEKVLNLISDRAANQSFSMESAKNFPTTGFRKLGKGEVLKLEAAGIDPALERGLEEMMREIETVTDNLENNLENRNHEIPDDAYHASVDTSNDYTKPVDIASLGGGKVIDVMITRGESGKKIPISVYLNPTINIISRDVFAGFAKLTKMPKSLRERFVAFFDKKTINSLWDYISANDYIRARDKSRVEDISGYMEEYQRRRRNAYHAGLLAGEYTIGSIANTWIITPATLAAIEKQGLFSIKHEEKRNKFMQETGCMTLIVFDSDYQVVTVYNHGISTVAEMTMSLMKKKEKDSGNVADMFKMLSQGNNVF